MDGSSRTSAKAVCNSKIVSGRNALRTSGRLIVILAMPSNCSYLMSWNVGSSLGSHWGDMQDMLRVCLWLIRVGDSETKRAGAHVPVFPGGDVGDDGLLQTGA